MKPAEAGKSRTVWQKLVQPQVDGGIQPIFVAATFVFFAVLGFLFPLSGDDWTWASQTGLDRMNDGFFGHYNGRYAGNFCVIVLTRVIWLRALVVGVAMTVIVYGGYAFANRRRRWLYWLMLALVLFMQIDLWDQCVVWTSGFVNYTLPMAGLIVWLNVFRGVFAGGYAGVRKRWGAVLFVFALANGLFLETVTICMIVASASLAVYARRRHGVWDIAQLCFLAGAVVALVVMFANPSYYDPDGLHTVSKLNGLYGIARAYAQKFGYMGFGQNVALNACFAAVAALALRGPKLRGAGVGTRSLAVLFAVAAAIMVYSAYRALTRSGASPMRIADAIVALAFLACVLYICVVLWRRLYDHRPLFLVLCALLTILPLLVLPTSVFRCFYFEYVFLSVFMCVIADDVLAPGMVGDRAMACALGAVCAVGVALLLVVYGSIYSVYCHRADDVARQLEEGQRTVELQKLPFGRYVHRSDGGIVDSADMMSRFREYYAIPDDVAIEFVE